MESKSVIDWLDTDEGMNWTRRNFRRVTLLITTKPLDSQLDEFCSVLWAPRDDGQIIMSDDAPF